MNSQPSSKTRCSIRVLALGMLAATASFPDRTCAHEPSPAGEPDDPVIRILDWDETRELIRSEFQGRVVVVNLWTTSCPACLEDFSEFARLQDRFDHDEFACLALNCDYDGVAGKPPEYYRPRVTEFLKQQPSGIEEVMLSDPLLDFMEEVELNSTPALFLFDENGKLVQRFDNDDADSSEDEFTFEQIEESVRRLLE